MAELRSNNDTAMDDIRRQRASKESVKGVALWNLKEIETALSAAATASLRVIPEERPGFIALTLLGQDASGAELLTSPPVALDDEIAKLSLMLRDAVNAAARRQEAKLTPLHHIAGTLSALQNVLLLTLLCHHALSNAVLVSSVLSPSLDLSRPLSTSLDLSRLSRLSRPFSLSFSVSHRAGHGGARE